MITTVPTVLCCSRSGGTAGRVIRVSPGQLASAVHCQAAVTTASQRGAGYPLPLPTPHQEPSPGESGLYRAYGCQGFTSRRGSNKIGLLNLPNSNNIRRIGLKIEKQGLYLSCIRHSCSGIETNRVKVGEKEGEYLKGQMGWCNWELFGNRGYK